MAKFSSLLRSKMSPETYVMSEEKKQMIQAIIETADDMKRVGMLNDIDYDRIKKRIFKTSK